MPVHALLGGAVRDRVRADYWMGQQTPEDSKRSVRRALALGFKVKIKCRLEEPNGRATGRDFGCGWSNLQGDR
ncbi:MAG: hypothetical protein R2932_55030 [Caldilineaceae bacterium]